MAILSRNRGGVLKHAAVVMWAVAVAFTAQAQGPRAVKARTLTERAATLRGKLEIYRLEFEDSGRRVYQLVLDGKTLHEQKGYNIVSVASSHPAEGPARVMLLELTTGGSGCPMFYRVLEVKDDGSHALSKEFGNCAKARTTFADGVLLIDIPKIGGAAAQSWRYQHGKLSKVAKPARTGKK